VIRLLPLIFLVTFCAKPVAGFYSKLHVDDNKGPVIVKSAHYDLHRDSFSYAVASDHVVTMKDALEMPSREKMLLFKRAFLRKAAIQSGLKEGIFDSEEAQQYILPRLESILEDYYYYEKARPDRIKRSLSSLNVDDESLAALLKEDPALARVASPEKLRHEKDRILERLYELRMAQAKKQAMENLLKTLDPQVVL